jgi:putative oxidoreductase
MAQATLGELSARVVRNRGAFDRHVTASRPAPNLPRNEQTATMLAKLYAMTTRGLSARWTPLPLRLIVGYGFLEHGLAKLGRGVGSFAHILHALGMPFPDLLAWATVLVEVLGGVAILAGAFVAFASVPMAIVLLVAIFTVHLPNGFSSIKLQSVDGGGAHFGQPGYETDLLYLAGLASLVLGGAGRWSVDRLLEQRSNGACKR